MYREVLAVSDDTPFTPSEALIGQYAEAHDNMPWVKDEKRFDVRDKTAKQALVQLGTAASKVQGFGFNYQRLGGEYLNKAKADPNSIPYGVKKQMKWIHYF